MIKFITYSSGDALFSVYTHERMYLCMYVLWRRLARTQKRLNTEIKDIWQNIHGVYIRRLSIICLHIDTNIYFSLPVCVPTGRFTDDGSLINQKVWGGMRLYHHHHTSSICQYVCLSGWAHCPHHAHLETIEALLAGCHATIAPLTTTILLFRLTPWSTWTAGTKTGFLPSYF